MEKIKIKQSDLPKVRRKVEINTSTKVHPDKRKDTPRKQKHKKQEHSI